MSEMAELALFLINFKCIFQVMAIIGDGPVLDVIKSCQYVPFISITRERGQHGKKNVLVVYIWYIHVC